MDPSIPEYLITRYLAKEASAEEQASLQKWIAQSEEHQAIFNEYCAVWQKQEQSLPHFDAVRALHRMESRIDASSKKVITPIYWARIAAGFLLATLLGLTLYFNYKDSAHEEIAWTTRTTSSGQKRVIQLADGTKVMLNTNSQLRWPEQFKGNTREVFLEGEAFFEVAHDADHPFIVHTASALTTKVLGTSFNIKQLGDVVSITLAIGKIAVTGKNVEEVLVPSQKLTYSLAKENWVLEKVKLEKELAWKDGIIILENERLEAAIVRLEQWFNVTIWVENEAIKNCRITGKFKNETLENILSAISDATGVQYEISKQNVKLLGKGCK